MKKILTLLSASIAAVGLQAEAGNIAIKKVYSLGDSLTDVGTYSNFVKQMLPDCQTPPIFNTDLQTTRQTGQPEFGRRHCRAS